MFYEDKLNCYLSELVVSDPLTEGQDSDPRGCLQGGCGLTVSRF